MRIRKNICDICNKETELHYEEKGWISLNIKELGVSKGKEKNSFAEINSRQNEKLDFCEIKCLNQYFFELIST